MKNRAMKFFLPLLPKNKMSQWVGKAVGTQLPGPLSKLSVKSFVQYFKIDMSEAEHPIEAYKSIGDLFIRRLKPNARPIAESFVVHPADGVVIEADMIRSQTLFQSKGLEYSLLELIREPQWAKYFEGGTYVTTYLCPTDYHRVHSPVEGEILWTKHIPGKLWPVNGLYVKTFPKLFVSNERVVMGIKTSKGHAIVIMVGATNVGKISLSFDKAVITNQSTVDTRVSDRFYEPAKPIAKGGELGIFHMGSTTICLFEKGMITKPPQDLMGPSKMGQSLA